MIILVLNCGSSSIKCKLFNMYDEVELVSIKVERIGTKQVDFCYRTNKRELKNRYEDLSYYSAVKQIIDFIIDSEYGVIRRKDEVTAVGHRIVHGGDFFSDTVFITNNVKKIINEVVDLAPLHNPAHLLGIEAIEKTLPGVPNIAVFDTAFYQRMNPEVFLYPIPKSLYIKNKIRKYGAHGISHKYVVIKAAEFLDRKLEELKIISCHIGNGVSITAVKNGKAFDTSMGLTPLEGLMMGTRSGDIDPAIIPYLIEKENMTVEKVMALLNNKSGLLGISGLSSDMRDIEERIHANKNCKLAFEMYIYRIRKYIGSYIAAMNGVDVIIFTAGIGENSASLRYEVIERLSWFGVKLDLDRNMVISREARRISTNDSNIDILVIPTNEELMIARETSTIVKST